ncbi:MAG TPA: TerD family protein, partial [Cellvibrionaceae bacterium]|nr:TerD family protein [Cellvibrionaceae bacterium]
LRLGLGWNANADKDADFDLDASVFMLTTEGKVRGDGDFIFYGQLRSSCGGVEHTGDNRTGLGDGDDEMLSIRLAKIPLEISRLVVAVTIHEAEARGQNFGKVEDAFIRLVNLDTGTELARFDLTEDYSNQTALIFGELYRAGDDWKFKAVGQGFAGDLRALALLHGVDVQ